MKMPRSTSIRLGIVGLLLAILPACASRNIVQTPTGRFQIQPAFNQYTPQQDIELGRQASAEVDRQLPILPVSSRMTKYVQKLGQALASHAPGPNKWPFSFHVVNAREINAFALPGGPIYVNVGTLQAADDEGELAGVLAHEISHVVLRHSTQQASKQVFAQLPIAVLGATIGQGAGGSLAELGASFGLQSLFLKYSRDAEKEADLLGSQIMYDAGYDPYSMAEFFSKLEKEGASRAPQFLSDHPDPGNRVESVRQAISKYPRKRYRTNSREFERIKRLAAKLHPLTSQEIAQRQRGQHQAIHVTLDDIRPNGKFRNLDHKGFRISYPDNWEAFGDSSSPVTLAPRAAASQNSVAYGVIINSIRRTQNDQSLDEATQELVDSLRQSNAGLRVTGTAQSISVANAPARSIHLLGNSPLESDQHALEEQDWLVTVERPDGSLLYLVFVAPNRDFEQLLPTYKQMLDSLQLKAEAD